MNAEAVYTVFHQVCATRLQRCNGTYSSVAPLSHCLSCKTYTLRLPCALKVTYPNPELSSQVVERSTVLLKARGAPAAATTDAPIHRNDRQHGSCEAIGNCAKLFPVGRPLASSGERM